MHFGWVCSAALWEWWLLPFRSIHDNWCHEKLRSRAGLQKPSSRSKILSLCHLLVWMGICLVLWMWCSFFPMALLVVTDFNQSEKEVGWVRSVWCRNWQPRLLYVQREGCGEGSTGGGRKCQNPCSFCQHASLKLRLCYPTIAVQSAGGDTRRCC